MRTAPVSTLLAALILIGCADNARLPAAAGIGAAPALPAPALSALPTIAVAPARGWDAGEAPTPAPGLSVTAFAAGLDHPRWLTVLPNGDVLVAEFERAAKPPENAPRRGDEADSGPGRSGGAEPGPHPPPARRGRRRRGRDRSEFLSGLVSPFGMALVGEELYVADTDALLRFRYRGGETRIGERGTVLAALPAGAINHHWTKGLAAGPDGRTLFVSVGSNSDHGENGIEAEKGRAAIWEVDRATGATRIFASGLRNPVGLDFEPRTGTLWTVVNERDELGGDLVPDYLTSVDAGSFYGWPYSYYGGHLDPRVTPQRPDLVEHARVPDYALGPHGAPLGLTFAADARLGARFAEGAFVGQHGSWNRKPRYGYRVIFVPFRDGRPSGAPQEVLTGFLDAAGNARGRPVGVAIDRRGALLVADDVGNVVWRVTGEPGELIRSASARARSR